MPLSAIFQLYHGDQHVLTECRQKQVYCIFNIFYCLPVFYAKDRSLYIP